MNISKVLPNLKMAFSIAFNLVSKFASCHIAATDIAGAEFILTIPDSVEIGIVVIVEGEISVTRVFLLAVVFGTVAPLFIGGKVSDIMNLKSKKIKMLSLLRRSP